METVVSRAARADLRDIIRYTGRRWGAEQVARYRADVDATIARIGNYPNLGRPRPDIGPTFRSIRIEQHTIVYAVKRNRLVVSRIFHDRQEFPSESSEA